MKVNRRKKEITTEQKIRIVTDYNGNMPITEIMQRYNVARSTIYKVIWEAEQNLF